MTLFLKKFQDLSSEELYGVLQLREAVFTFEQKVEEEDLDGEDQLAHHIFIKKGPHVLACGRFFVPGSRYGKDIYFGRFVVAKDHRGQGLAQKIFKGFMDYATRYHPESDIILSSQCYIKGFYEKYGFQSVGEPYDEAGIDHIKMLKKP